MKVLKTILYYYLPIILIGCSPALQSGSSSTTNTSYSEDISAYRPHYEVAQKDTTIQQEEAFSLNNFNPQHDITDTLNALLDSISILSQQIRYVDGYAIQIYSGNNRETARIRRGKASSILGEQPSLFYDSPNFKVHVGQYYSALDANKTFALLKKEFPNAILVLKKFKIDRE
ncbi:MAG: hypothetical protein OEX22_05615 [Cyclobacteriaceae bacterium]|nr:hypothetical protein [Cyclobacteriaceae bacterium]